jgi:nicotinate phosphoribosyltransferase
MHVVRTSNDSGPGLITDLYQLTMAFAYWHYGIPEREATFHLSFRKAPFGSGFTVASGLESAADYLSRFRFTNSDLKYLSTIQGRDGKPIFTPPFLDYLRKLRFTCDVDAIPEGTLVFPHEPLLRVQGPILQAQLVETALLNFLNFQSLVTTKAARICLAAAGDPVIEFGLRRAQGLNGGLTASRAAYVGGCVATSDVLAGKVYNIPVKGTHAHSWVMAFDDERAAFEAYARALPNNCIFLVDTYNSLAGVRNAVEVGRWLRSQGHELGGIRLDSGDLAYLSIEARKILDAGGFPKAQILASNDLDEHLITSLKTQGARIDAWGVGTKLVTAYDNPALGGVYKMSAIRDAAGAWDYKLKLSEQTAKISTPGILQVRRFQSDKLFLGDAIYDLPRGIPKAVTIVDPLDFTRRKHVSPEARWEDLLVPVFRKGSLVYQLPPLAQIRERTQGQLSMLHGSVKRLLNPHQYPAGLEKGLHDFKTELVLKAREL